jgi:hypothetical protein
LSQVHNAEDLRDTLDDQEQSTGRRLLANPIVHGRDDQLRPRPSFVANVMALYVAAWGQSDRVGDSASGAPPSPHDSRELTAG